MAWQEISRARLIPRFAVQGTLSLSLPWNGEIISGRIGDPSRISRFSRVKSHFRFHQHHHNNDTWWFVSLSFDFLLAPVLLTSRAQICPFCCWGFPQLVVCLCVCVFGSVCHWVRMCCGEKLYPLPHNHCRWPEIREKKGKNAAGNSPNG